MSPLQVIQMRSVRLTPGLDVSETLPRCTAEAKKLCEGFAEDPPPLSPVVQSESRRGPRGAGCGDVTVCPCGRGSCICLKCSYNVATGGQLGTVDYNEIKRCRYILRAYCNSLHGSGLFKRQYRKKKNK